jgi:hypothetical protein
MHFDRSAHARRMEDRLGQRERALAHIAARNEAALIDMMKTIETTRSKIAESWALLVRVAALLERKF